MLSEYVMCFALLVRTDLFNAPLLLPIKSTPRRVEYHALGLINPFIATIKPQSNGPSYSNTVIGTLAVDGLAVIFGTARRGSGRAAAPPSPLLAAPNVTAHPSTASAQTSYYSM